MPVAANEEVLGITPLNGGELQGQIYLPGAGAGKAKIGQDVIVTLAHYPAQEFGTIRGKVKQIATLPTPKGYYTLISIPQDMKSSYNKKLRFYQNMEGQAEILTDKRSLFSRVFDQLSQLKKHVGN